MPHTIPPILITSSIFPTDPNTRLYNPKDRIKHLIESIEKWQRISRNLRIVICDGSGADITKEIKCIAKGSFKIETLSFENNYKKVAEFGKGYGEIEIIDYALLKSETLRDSKVFSKCTGRLWVNNYLSCATEMTAECGFRLDLNLKYLNTKNPTPIDTRFYITTKDFYVKHLSPLKNKMQANDRTISVEELFGNAIFELGRNDLLFQTLPIISGIGGASGRYYNTSALRIIKDKIKWEYIKNHKKHSRS